MPPKGSKKGSATSPNKAASPTRETAAIRKASVTKSKSPVKEAVSRAPSPAKKTVSPRKRSASPAKAAAYKATMTRTTRAASAAPSEPPAANVKTVLYKRGVLGTDDNDDDPTQPFDDVIAAFSKRSLTTMDKYLIERIKAMEEDGNLNVLDDGINMSEQEMTAAAHGLPLDCHTKIYWRFLDMFARKYDGQYPSVYWDERRHNASKTLPTKASARAASRSPSKPPSPTKASSMSRPLRWEKSRSAPSPSRATSDQAAGPSRISKADTLNTARGSRARMFSSGSVTQEETTANPLDSYYLAAYDAFMGKKKMPAPPKRTTVPSSHFYAAQQRAIADANAEMGGGNAMVIDTTEDELTPHPALKPGKQRVASRSQSPGKQLATPRAPSPAKGRSPSRAQSPAKAQPSTRSQSPAKGPSVRRPSVAAPPPEVEPVETGRGLLVSGQNPAKIQIKRDGYLEMQDNPFFESMPAPEVWHRRMPPVFPFGETPFMARVVSDQINADLSRNHADDDKTAQDTGILSGVRRTVQNLGSSLVGAVSPTKATASAAAAAKIKKIPSIWDLPEVDESYRAEIERAAASFKAANNPANLKRSAPGYDPVAEKRARGPRSGGRPLF